MCCLKSYNHEQTVAVGIEVRRHGRTRVRECMYSDLRHPARPLLLLLYALRLLYGRREGSSVSVYAQISDVGALHLSSHVNTRAPPPRMRISLLSSLNPKKTKRRT